MTAPDAALDSFLEKQMEDNARLHATVSRLEASNHLLRVRLVEALERPIGGEMDAHPSAFRTDGGRARVLVIDDDALLGRLVGRMIGREHDVTLATSAREALDRIGVGARFDLILCDLMMPGWTGVDFHERLAPIAPEQLARVVYMTGGAFSPRTRAFLERASIRHIEKPFGLVELQRLVRKRET